MTDVQKHVLITLPYFRCLKYSERKTLANNVDPDQTPRSDQGLHRLPLLQFFLGRHVSTGVKMAF